MKSIEPASMIGDRPAAERHVMTLVVLVATVLVARVLGLYIRHIYDDAFITFRYAKNLAAGHGFVFNVGERVLGTTAPLWGLVLALFAWARVPLTTLVPVLNTLLDCVTVLLVLFYCRRRNWLLPALFFAVMFAGDPNMVRIPVGGMETSLLLVLCVWALVLFDNGRRIVAAVLVAVCYFLRPESLLLLGLLLVLTAQERRWRELALMAGLSVLVVGIPLGLIWAYYGSPIAHSVAAKSSGLNGRLLPVLKEELAVNPVHLLVLPLAVWGATRVVHQRGLARHSLIWGAVYGAVFLLLRPPVWGWYFVPLYFAKFLLAGFGIADIVGRIRGLSRVSVRAWALAGSGLVLLTGVA
ncbi:MAG: hypothetical protein ABIK44_02330, partial [candidate division WOR-3 bacterium]